MKKISIFIIVFLLVLMIAPVFAAGNTPIATGDLTLGNPKQQISFGVFGNGANGTKKSEVEYQNFEYSGGMHYIANVLYSKISGNRAWFVFRIPDGFSGLSGLYVVSFVQDNGTPGSNGDLYGHALTDNLDTAKSWCENGNAPITLFPITAGDANVQS